MTNKKGKKTNTENLCILDFFALAAHLGVPMDFFLSETFQYFRKKLQLTDVRTLFTFPETNPGKGTGYQVSFPVKPFFPGKYFLFHASFMSLLDV